MKVDGGSEGSSEDEEGDHDERLGKDDGGKVGREEAGQTVDKTGVRDIDNFAERIERSEVVVDDVRPGAVWRGGLEGGDWLVGRDGIRVFRVVRSGGFWVGIVGRGDDGARVGELGFVMNDTSDIVSISVVTDGVFDGASGGESFGVVSEVEGVAIRSGGGEGEWGS